MIPSNDVVRGLRRLACALALAAVGSAVTAAPAQQSSSVRVRGSVESFDAKTLVLKERSGEHVSLAVAADMTVSQSVPMDASAIKPGAFVGIAAMQGNGGELKSLEVVVFPEAARGTGEGHYAWDLLPESTMTNATVTGVVGQAGPRTVTLHYTDPKTGPGDKTIVVPSGTPIVTFQPADAKLLTPGAKVFVITSVTDGKPTARRVVVGKDGVAPPM